MLIIRQVSQFKIFLLITSYILFSEFPAPWEKGAKKFKEEDDHKENKEDSDEEEPEDNFKPKKSPKKQSLKTTTKKEKPNTCWLRAAVEKAGAKKDTPAAGSGKSKAKPNEVKRASKGVDPDSLPILVKPQDMFDDLCARNPRFGEFAKALGRPLRVATMCSGTESPVLALGMMCKAVRQ